MPYWMGGILLDAKTDRHGPQEPSDPPSTCILCAQEGSHYQPYNDTIQCVRAPAIPFGFHQSRAAADGDLIRRVNQELMSGGLKRPCWTLWESSGKGLYLKVAEAESDRSVWAVIGPGSGQDL